MPDNFEGAKLPLKKKQVKGDSVLYIPDENLAYIHLLRKNWTKEDK